MQSYQKLLLANKAWAAEKLRLDESYFENLSANQSPEFLWIGCADSRVPADQVTGTQPGDIFVHRNVANLVVHTDINMLSVLQYAVEVLKVKHILVVGHYNCGGVKASMDNKDYGLINKWLRHIKDVNVKHIDELSKIDDFQSRFDRLVELNVVEQVRNLAKTTIVQKAWANGDYPHLHGWVLDLKSGLIKTIMEIFPDDLSAIEEVYRYELPVVELSEVMK
ncbi:carbonic anhydrase [Emticicia oligotrophica DSM 17448]|uniref:Carbonic anhydrase n=1 Tax=Emticicia oligotrophica (strain DSM 17448 / CIP 109782 / MTCC 6937 / GPTSA100-15) TaxID=929562 RepID=A0ABM5N691_EMTOG|nr:MULTISPECIES: carbonic anhydrase [Emticicia]AFK04924.1 carbonic anhydrase [Emticicia oligotrophica DSM 17448]